MGDGTASRQRSAVQKSSTALQRPSWDFISDYLGKFKPSFEDESEGLA
jgi:hypothetical protein